MKPPYIQITATCELHGTISDTRKPNKLQGRPQGREGFYDAIRCTKCGLWAKITSQRKVIGFDPASKPDQSVPLLPGMEG